MPMLVVLLSWQYFFGQDARIQSSLRWWPSSTPDNQATWIECELRTERDANDLKRSPEAEPTKAVISHPRTPPSSRQLGPRILANSPPPEFWGQFRFSLSSTSSVKTPLQYHNTYMRVTTDTNEDLSSAVYATHVLKLNINMRWQSIRNNWSGKYPKGVTNKKQQNVFSMSIAQICICKCILFSNVKFVLTI